MSSSSKSSRDYLRKHRRAILEPWRQSHNLPPSPPSPPPNRTLPTSLITTNSLSSPSPPQNPTQNQIAHELHHLSNLLEINLQHANEATNPSPRTSPCIPPPTLDQVNFHSGLCHYRFLGAPNEGELISKGSLDIVDFFLSTANAKNLKLYSAYELCDENVQLHVFDSDETLEDARKSRLKMKEFQKDESVQYGYETISQF
ncbi:hypothetical protein Tco_0833533 [Tanacetum coccineum]